MGLVSHHIHPLCMEQKKTGFIRGDVLTLGQQSVWIDSGQLSKILKSHKLVEYPLKDNIDYRNKINEFRNTPKENNPSCKALFTIMGADNVEVMDFSNYESPDIVHDLNYPIPKELFNKYDLIIDSGTLEHIFDIPTALKNICDMLKPGGSLFLSNPSSNAIDHGFYSFSPTLYFDFFEANGFKNLRTYLFEGSPRIYERKGRLFRYKHTTNESPIVTSRWIEVYFFAEKTLNYNSDHIKKPIQYFYSKNKKNFEGIRSVTEKKGFLINLKFLLKKLFLKLLKYLPYEFERVFFNILRRDKSLKYIGRF